MPPRDGRGWMYCRVLAHHMAVPRWYLAEAESGAVGQVTGCARRRHMFGDQWGKSGHAYRDPRHVVFSLVRTSPRDRLGASAGRGGQRPRCVLCAHHDMHCSRRHWAALAPPRRRAYRGDWCRRDEVAHQARGTVSRTPVALDSGSRSNSVVVPSAPCLVVSVVSSTRSNPQRAPH